MRAGRLRHSITIQRLTAARDEFGAPVESWQDVAPLRAGVEPLTGREFFAAQQVNSEVSVRIVVRFRSGILSEMRAVHGADIYDILAVIPDARRREMQLLCKVVNP